MTKNLDDNILRSLLCLTPIFIKATATRYASMMNIHKKAALLIDGDNVKLDYMEQVVEISEYYGELKIRNIYGDWKKPPLILISQNKLNALNIEHIQVDRIGKEATDHHMLVEAGEMLASNFPEDINVFIIATGDGGFTSACRLIQERGRQVVVIGHRENTSLALQKACDKFYALEDLNKELDKLKKRQRIPPNKVREFFMPLFLAYHQITPKQYVWISYSQLDAVLRQMPPDFQIEFRKYSLSEWLRNFDEDFEIDQKGQKIRKIDSNIKEARFSALLSAYFDTKGPDDLAPLNQFGKALRLDPYYEYRFGSKKLSYWLKAYPERFEIRDNQVAYNKFW